MPEEKHIKADPLLTTPESSELEKYKVLYDLCYKQWESSYDKLPEQLRDKIFKLVTIYTASAALIPTLLSYLFATFKPIFISCDTLRIIFAFISCVLALYGIVRLIFAFYFAYKIIRLGTFETYTPSELQGHIENVEPKHDLPMVYQIIIKHLQNITSTNMKTHEELAKSYRKSYLSFYFGFSAGIISFIIALSLHTFF